MIPELEVGLIKLINSRLGISDTGFTKLASLTSGEFRGGLVKDEDIFFIILHKKYEEHQENYISIRSDERNYYVGYAFVDGDITNILFTELVNNRFIVCNTAMKLSISLFVEMFAQLQVPPEFVSTSDEKLYDFEKFYIASYPDDI